jgi:hypothetical protein
MLRRVALVRADVSEEPSASIIRVTRIGELGELVFLRNVLQLLVTASVDSNSPILVAPMMEAERQHSCRPDDGGAKTAFLSP